MKRLYYIFFFITLILACNNKTHENKFIIKLNLKNLPQQETIKLIYRLPENANVVDSVIADKQPIILKTHKKEGFYVIKFQNNNYPIFLYLTQPEDTIKITGDYKNIKASYKVKNSKQSELIANLENHLALTDSLYQKFQNDDKKIDSIFKEQKNFNLNFAWKHLNDIAVIIALSEKYPNEQPILIPLYNMRVFEAADSILMSQYPANLYVREFHTFVLNKKVKYLRDYKPLQIIKKNKKAINFKVPSITDSFQLSSIKNKIIVLHFWASWCNECIEKLRYIDQIKSAFNNVEVILFSLDVDKKLWLKTLSLYDIDATEVCDCKGWTSPIVEQYDVRNIPSNVIIDKNNKIIGLNIPDDKLFNKLQELTELDTIGSVFLKRKFKYNNFTLPYRIMFPENYSQTQKYPLILFFHGAGERGTDNSRQLIHIRSWTSEKFRKKYPCFILAPQCPKNMRWVETDWSLLSHRIPKEPSIPMSATISLLKKLIKLYPIDTNRIYVTGLSMGGFGTWDILAREPYLFAAAAPICGGADLNTACKISHIPIWVFHGAKDRVVSVERSRKMVEALKKCGGTPKYTEYPNIGHGAWVPAYKNQNLYQWMFNQVKKY